MSSENSVSELEAKFDDGGNEGKNMSPNWNPFLVTFWRNWEKQISTRIWKLATWNSKSRVWRN